MATYRNGNYAAFYVSEPFSESNLRANATPDFMYYNMLRMWAGGDSSFNFIDSHDKNYNVRDDSDWEMTLKPRLRERLRNSKNIILFLSSVTRGYSRALNEEIDYGINNLGLPVIVVYPDYKSVSNQYGSSRYYRSEIKHLWDNLPIFGDNMYKVPTLHIPLVRANIANALRNSDFMVQTKRMPGIYF